MKICPWREIGVGSDGRRVAQCQVCGGRITTPFEVTRIVGCMLPTVLARSRWPLGRWVAIGLLAVGITKQRWNWLRRILGFRQPCGCAQRERKLNSLGEIVRGWISRLFLLP